ncbi:uncharacterized protein LOC100845193 isoform X3 [Brachypodium distachyon]|uniref:Uncharacterized protein n=1 Tax=Brachypodium distachyon TaxID=15368 RepID=A0A0Q3LKJ4_BRADI|nr:uncharacterized protein LOC100845193 isoform X3 [Brachypodium distachyon]KQJ92989.1 hypothetical protein BRADI_3g02067v3 [Brachypodium distachyon]|eukprot:XP_010233733.1 uncharacterized protein LOC100845193 isoform X3 [Brachypodium distachyon]
MVDMEEEKKKNRKLVVVGLTTRHSMMITTGSASSPPNPPHAATDNNRNESEGGAHIAEFRRKKGKKANKPLKWRSTNSDMNNGNGEAEGSDGDRRGDDTVLSSLTTAGSFSSVISRKRVMKTLGKVAEDSVDPPVPRKLRSAINKHAGRTVSSSPRIVKKRRHISAISAQIFFMDRETRFDATTSSNPFTKEEEVLASTLLSLCQTPPPCEPTTDMAMGEDISNTNVASTSCSEEAIKEDAKITVLPLDADKVATKPAHTDQQVERTGSLSQVNPPLGAPQDSINPHLPKGGQTKDLSLGLVANSPNPSKDLSNNSMWKHPKVQFDGSLSLTNPTGTEAPHWLVNCKKSDFAVHDGTKAEKNSAQEVTPTPPVRTPLPCTSKGYSTKPSSSTSATWTNPATGTAKASATANSDRLSLSKKGEPTKTWKKSITHVYVSHLIQNHLNKDKASESQVKPDEQSHVHTSKSPTGAPLNKNAAHLDARHLIQPPIGVRDTAAGQRRTAASSGILNTPTSAAFSGPQHVQYLHPQMIAHRGAAPYPYPQLHCSRGDLAPAMTIQQQMQQYMCSPGFAPHPGAPASSSAAMKLQRFVPTPQQQQQMWQFHFAQYQPGPGDGVAPLSWQNSRLQDMSSSLRPMPVIRPPPAMMQQQQQMELLCAPYQGGSGGGGRQPSQLRLI